MLVGGTTDLRVVMTSEQHCADFEKFAVVIKVQGFYCSDESLHPHAHASIVCHDKMHERIRVRVHMHVATPFVRYSKGCSRYI